MKSQKQQQAQDLFLHTANTQEQIADILDLNRKTIYLWVKNGKWQEMKKAAEQTPGMMRMKLYNFMESITRRVESREDECPTPQEVNMLQKLMKMDGMIEGNRVGCYIQAFEELLRFICAKDLALGKQVVTIADQFVRGNFGDIDFDLKKQSAKHIDEITKNLENLDKVVIPELPRDGQLRNNAPCATLTPHQVFAPSAPANEASMGQNEAQTGKNGAFSFPAENNLNPNTEATYQDIDNAKNAPLENNPENATVPIFIGGVSPNSASLPNCQIVELPNSPSLTNCQIDELSNSPSLPNSKKPFRDGNIIWVNSVNDIDEKTIKVGDIIRFFPAADLGEQNKRTA